MGVTRFSTQSFNLRTLSLELTAAGRPTAPSAVTYNQHSDQFR